MIPPFQKEFNRIRLLAASIMLGSSVLAWLITIPLMDQIMAEGMMAGISSSAVQLPILSMTSMFVSPDIVSISFFVFAWVVGMVAMMFPAMIPVIAIYLVLIAKSEPNPKMALTLGTLLFLGGYLLLYAILGIAAYAAIYAGFHLASMVPILTALAVPAAAGTLFGAGVWQFTPLKDKCLAKCVSPIGFFLTHARSGLSGAFRMGSLNGVYCVGCCYMYMVVMLAVAAMSIPSMLILMTLITVEKVLGGAEWFKMRWFKAISTAVFVALGATLLLNLDFPSLS